MGVSIVSKLLSKEHVLSIKSKTDFVDNNTLDGSNKMAMIGPFYSTLNVCFIKYRITHDRLSIDESMIPYYGQRSCKMFIRRKVNMIWLQALVSLWT